jgi:hypothetical protein
MISGIAVTTLSAQTPAARPLSPPGTAATQVGGDLANNVYSGNWIEVTYSRPLLRQRVNIFGAGADYGKTVNAGAPVWRAGANQTTRFKTEVALSFGGKTLPAGEYSMFVDLKPNAWTLIFSNWPAQQKYDANDKTALWGSFGYTPDKDVLRTPMKVEALAFSIDELTINFVDVTKTGGRLAIMWDKTLATAAFTVAK